MTDQAKETNNVEKNSLLTGLQFLTQNRIGYPVSSITTEVRNFLLQTSEAMENVTTTLLIEGTFAHDLRTFRVPLAAVSTISVGNNIKIPSDKFMLNYLRNIISFAI